MALSEDIKNRIDIIDVVSQYVPDLKQSGRSYKARCPFHSEDTPSFVVFPDRQSWRCFGACSTGGDVFTFVMKVESLDFSQALRSLGQQVGIQVENQSRNLNSPGNPILAANLQAQRFFRQALNSDKGSFARKYLSDRGLTEEGIHLFGLGYSPVNGNELSRNLENEGFSSELLVNAGLALQNEVDPPKDLFRGRLTFPIHNESGELVGFGGRALDESAPPKYLNTPQTAVFDKSGILYGLDKASSGINGDGRRVVIVEGYMDVIAAHEAGFRNVVASMGTSLTNKQISLALARADTIVLALDADAAGQNAMYRGLVDIAQQNSTFQKNVRKRKPLRQRSPAFDIFRVAQISTGKDPDDLIRTEPSLWRKTIDEAPSLADFLLLGASKFLSGLPLIETDQIISALAQVVFASHWQVQDKYVRQLAEIVGTTPAELESNLGKLKEKTATPVALAKRTPVGKGASHLPFRAPAGDPLEDHTLALVAQFPELLDRLVDLSEDRIKGPENRAVLSAFKQNGTIEEALESLEGQAAQQIHSLTEKFLPEMDFKQRSDALDSCIRRLEIRFYREIKQQEQTLLENIDANDSLSTPNLEANERLKNLYSSGT